MATDREREIERAIRRTKRYWYEDGLAELAGGAMFVLVGLLFFYQLAMPGVSGILLPLVIIGGAWLTRVLVNGAKERLTYPRTGYVAYTRPDRARSRQRTALVAVFMSMLVSALITASPATLAWIPALQGLLIAAAFLYWGYTLGLARFYALAVVSAFTGTSASLAGLGDLPGSATYFVIMGLASVGSGALTLRAYLRATTPAD